MPKDEWGVKRLCPNCQGRFYDLQKEQMVCPYCAAEFSLDNLISNKPQIEKADAKAKDDKAKDAAVDDTDDILDDDADIDVDDDLLDDDEDDDNVSLEEIADVASDDDED